MNIMTMFVCVHVPCIWPNKHDRVLKQLIKLIFTIIQHLLVNKIKRNNYDIFKRLWENFYTWFIKSKKKKQIVGSATDTKYVTLLNWSDVMHALIKLKTLSI